jgi:hypothetical protein
MTRLTTLSNKKVVIPLVICFVFFIHFRIEVKAFLAVIISIYIIILGIHHFYLSISINLFMLIYLPFLLKKYNYVFLRNEHSYIMFTILVCVFLTTIINFLVVSFNLNSTISISKKSLLNILAIFVLYFTLIYSVINCFAILYAYLSNIFNEGIVSELEKTVPIDALYFSTTTFFTIGLGDIYPTQYSEATKILVIMQAIISHIINVILWPIGIIFLFDQKKKGVFQDIRKCHEKDK